MYEKKVVEIRSRDYWFKIVDFLQQNWALVDSLNNDAEAIAYFFGDTSGVFDTLVFPSPEDAELSLRQNGFRNIPTMLRLKR